MPNDQRGKLDLATLEQHFHIPMQEVAKKFGVCMTFFKKICRSLGIKRWPYRKLKSLQHKIETLQASVKEKADVGQAKVLAEKIDELQQLNLLRGAAINGDAHHDLAMASDTFDVMQARLEMRALVHSRQAAEVGSSQRPRPMPPQLLQAGLPGAAPRILAQSVGPNEVLQGALAGPSGDAWAGMVVRPPVGGAATGVPPHSPAPGANALPLAYGDVEHCGHTMTAGGPMSGTTSMPGGMRALPAGVTAGRVSLSEPISHERLVQLGLVPAHKGGTAEGLATKDGAAMSIASGIPHARAATMGRAGMVSAVESVGPPQRTARVPMGTGVKAEQMLISGEFETEAGTNTLALLASVAAEQSSYSTHK